MNPFGSIYLATNIVTGKRYIGQTTQSVAVRWMRHVSDALGVKERPYPLHNSIRKYGAAVWRVETLGSCDSFAELNALETQMIVEHGTLHPLGYNLKPGGNNAGHHPTTKKRLGDALRGRKLPLELVEKLRRIAKARGQTDRQREGLAKCHERSRLLKGQPGTPATAEARRRMSASRRGVAKSKAHAQAIGRAHLGMKRSEETRRRISEAHKRRAPVTDETKAKLSLTLRGRERPDRRRTHCKRGHLLPEWQAGVKRRCRICNYQVARAQHYERLNAKVS